MAEITFSAQVSGGQLQFQEPLDAFEGQEVRVTLSAPFEPPSGTCQPDGGTAADLLSSQVVGIWSDRAEISDGLSFARQLREQAQNRGVSVNAPRQ